ncbi:MAG: hypothetical protein V1707_03785, partial [bacterium]
MKKPFAIGAAVGGVLGAIGALFVASKYSKGLRDDIGKTADQLEEMIRRQFGELKELGSEKHEDIVATVLEQARKHPELAGLVLEG